jgi:hypothetical protein
MPTRPPHKRREDRFFLALVLLILAVNFIGFARTYYLAGILRAPLPSPLVHIHGALFSCWLLLLLLQTVLVSLGRIRWHRQLGILGGILAALMLIFGPLVLFGALHRHAFSLDGANLIFAADMGGLILFALFVFLGLRLRNHPIAHKRLMLFSTIAILPPSLSRWTFHFMDPLWVFLVIYLAFPLSIVLFDLFSSRKVHRVTWTCALLITVYVLGATPLSHTAAWHHLTAKIQGPTP